MPRTSAKPKPRLLRWLPLTILVLGCALFFILDGPSYINLDTLKESRHELQTWVHQLGVVAPILYAILYALATAFSLPLGLILTVAAGFLFGIGTGLISVVIGATFGATAIFLAVRLGFGPTLDRLDANWINRMRDGFNKNAFSYMLVLRLIPAFPFVLVNIAPALLGVSPLVYVFGTLIGIVPGSFVYIMLGNGIGAIFDAGGTPNLGLLFEPQILIPILALAALALLPVAYNALTRRKPAPKEPTQKTPPRTKRAKHSKTRQRKT